MARTTRGVSDVIGFTLVFALIAITVGIVYVAGFSGLENAQGAERVDNAERAFDVLGDNVADISREEAPSRATEIKLSDAQLAFGTSTTISTKITNMNGNPVFRTSLDPIIYSANGRPTKLAFEAGAVIRVERDSAIFTRNPRFLFIDDGGTRRAVLQMVETRRVGDTSSVGGDTTVLVRAERARTELINASTTPSETGDGQYNVSFTVETTPDRASVWAAYLNGEIPASLDDHNDKTDGKACTHSSGTVTCKIAVERLYVSTTRIDVWFER